MNKSICYAVLMAIVFVLPEFVSGQANLDGIWRLKESKKIKGPDYTNAVPLIINIEQNRGVITLAITSNNGEKDTLITESSIYGEKGINESLTTSGKKKAISFKMNRDSSWLKQTEIFTKEDTTKLQSVNKETFTVYNNGKGLLVFREYDGNDDPSGNQDFTVEGIYEKITREELAKEIATGKGVNFIEGLTWEQIKEKAKNENKYIFVDCYATWCRPCKMMDKYVYPLNIVGEAMNANFLAVKVQVDSTKKDPASVRLLYSLARQLEKEYGIAALPSYLFFSPDGTIVHKAIGQQDAKQFITLLINAKKPERQLYTLLSKAKKRELPWADYPVLAKRLKEEFGEKNMAKEVASVYNQEYLNKLSEKNLITRPILDFIGEYYSIVKSTDKIFMLCLKYPHLVDSIKQYEGGGWADRLVKKIVIREEIEPLFAESERLNKTPDWIRLSGILSKKYNKNLAITFVLDARVDWYEKKKNWVLFLQYLRPHLARHDLKKIDNLHLHYCAWYVFKYSKDLSLMKEAVNWMDILIENTPEDGLWMLEDTKAYLLYKMGKREEAIGLIKKIIERVPQFSYAYRPNMEKMIKGEEIWLSL